MFLVVMRQRAGRLRNSRFQSFLLSLCLSALLLAIDQLALPFHHPSTQNPASTPPPSPTSICSGQPSFHYSGESAIDSQRENKSSNCPPPPSITLFSHQRTNILYQSHPPSPSQFSDQRLPHSQSPAAPTTSPPAKSPVRCTPEAITSQ